MTFLHTRLSIAGDVIWEQKTRQNPWPLRLADKWFAAPSQSFGPCN